MKKLVLLAFLALFIPAVVCGQGKIEAPVWNVGDRWILPDDVKIMVSNADDRSYTVKYLIGSGESTIIYERATLNRLYTMDRNRRAKYEGRNRRLFNFPLEIGKSWDDKFTAKSGAPGAKEVTYLETFTPAGWEDIEIKAGKFKALKIEYKQATADQIEGRPKEGKLWYWYSPDVKYMLKCQYEKSPFWEDIFDWEILSFELKK